MKTCKDCHRLSVERERLSEMLTGANNRESKLIKENAQLRSERDMAFGEVDRLQARIFVLESKMGGGV